VNGQTEILRILTGNALTQLVTLPDESVQCCVTSPPYWGLRNYGVEGQLGLETTPQGYVERLTGILREVKRVLRKDGTFWLNLGDSYAGSGCGWGGGSLSEKSGQHAAVHGSETPRKSKDQKPPPGLKAKDLVGIPWMVAFALRADGWYLRSEITWCKKVPMPESVQDRPTAATEKIFLLSKSPRYFYNADAVRNPPSESYANDSRWQTGSTDHNEKNGYEEAGAQNPKRLHRVFDKQRGHSRRHAGFNDRWDAMEKSEQCANGSNMRNYWILGPEPYPESHFATFPSHIPTKAILAGSKPGDVILDPFAGSGTTGMVALELGRKALLIELNPEYVKLIHKRCDVNLGLAIA
jgi:DNA modification methylase